MSKTDKIKLAVAIVLLLGAIGIAIWYFSGSSGNPALPDAPEPARKSL